MICVRRPVRSLLFVLIIGHGVLLLLNLRLDEMIYSTSVDIDIVGPDNASQTLHRSDAMIEYIDVGEKSESYNSHHTDNTIKRNLTAKQIRHQQLVALSKLMRRYNKLYSYNVYGRAAPKSNVFYISAIVSTTDNKVSITFNGWQGIKHAKDTIYCCVQYNNQTSVHKVTTKNIIDISHIKLVTATRFICPVPSIYADATPVKAGLALNNASCHSTEYIQVEQEERPGADLKPSLAVCGKILYGDYFTPGRVLEWLEINRLLGVDKVVLYTFNITDDTKVVLQHYVNKGFLVTKEFNFPFKSVYPRYLGQKYMMAYMDEQVVVYDCVSRLQKYSYFTIMDVDEFIMPRTPNKQYKPFLKQLSSTISKASGFALRTVVFVTDWRTPSNTSDTYIEEYTLRTRPKWDRVKSIIQLNRVHPHSIWTHGFTSKKGYYKSMLGSHTAVLNHYRECRTEWKNTICVSPQAQVKDLAMKTVVDKYRKQIVAAQKLILPHRMNSTG